MHHVIRLILYYPMSTGQTLDDIKITPLDAIYWIDAAWQCISLSTIQNTFRSAGFEYDSHNPTATTTFDSPAASPSDNTAIVIDEGYEQLQLLDKCLGYITFHGQTMTAADFVDIDNDTPAFNKWFDSCENILVYVISMTKIMMLPMTKLVMMIMIQKLRLFGTTQQPQLHELISELESKLIDIYIDSTRKKTNNNRGIYDIKLNFVFDCKVFDSNTLD